MPRTMIGLAMAVAFAGFVELWQLPIAAPPSASARTSRRLFATDAPSRPPILANLLVDNEPLTRAAACEILGQHGGQAFFPSLLRRMLDEDPQVREAAGVALVRMLPASADRPRGRDPLDLPTWLEQWRSAAGDDTGPTLCEVFSDTRYLLIPDALVQRCLTCHAGRRPEPFTDSDACRECHAGIHQQWAASAHAQSLTHLRLRTSGGSASQPATIDFGDVRGIGCTECHEIAQSRGARILPAVRDPRTVKTVITIPPAELPPPPIATGSTSAPSETCPHTFTPIDPSTVCSRCHADTHRQWQQWRDAPHPRRADWPPGHIDMNARGDVRSCLDCHMPSLPDPAASRGMREHRWPARRDANVLRQGLDARLLMPDPQTAGGTATLVLTNLAGHAYPAGTARRAVRIEAGPSSASPLPVLAMLTDPPPGQPPSPEHQPPLQSGEQRRLPILVPPHADSVSWRISYVRSILDPQSPITEILTGEQRRHLWARPIPATASPPE